MAKMMLTIRQASENDLPDVMAIENASFSMPWTEAMYYNALRDENERFYIADESGWVVGYAVVGLAAPDSELLTIAVDRASRRRGVAWELLTWTIGQLRLSGCDTLYLEVRRSNEAAKSLYRRFGFEPVGLRSNYYASPVEDAIIMKKCF